MSTRPNTAAHAVDRWVFAAVLVYTAFLIGFGYVMHAEPADITPECDGYVAAARTILGGSVPRDVFRPLLYPALVAVTSWLPAVDVFEAGRIVSSLAAGGTVWCMYRIGALGLGSRGVGGVAAALFAMHPFVWTHGVMAATDLLFTFFCTASLFALVRCVVLERDAAIQISRSPLRGRLLSCGACIGLAWSTRYPGAALVVPVAVGLSISSGWRIGARQFGWVAASAVLVALPQGVANFAVFGDPLYNEAWRNLAFKLDGRNDFSSLYAPETEGLGWSGLIAAQPWQVLDGAIRELHIGVTRALPRSVGLGWIGPTMCVLAGLSVLEGVFGPKRTVSTPRRSVLLAIASFVLVYLVLVAATFITKIRLMLPITPAVLLLGSHALLSIVPRLLGSIQAIQLVRSAAVVGLLVVATSTPWMQSQVFARFSANRSPGVFAAAEWIEANAPDDVIVLGDHPHLGQYVRFRYIWEEHGAKQSVGDEAYLGMLEQITAGGGIDYLLFSSKWVEPRPRALVDGPTPSFLREVLRQDGAVLYAVLPH